ncbi:hypothetical protein BV898_00295 [Hypsibius exemplaris]|uniref:Uncharacterized protein n=1 Tax=Hypsibius exemplaris TaxID=2072580 RepID=A0A1W0XFI4_HYPEX|nr:hypothetical protein BV898_00295 [Hypsibius exemplaris]
MGNQQGKTDVRLYSGKCREEMQQNQPLRLSGPVSDRPPADPSNQWNKGGGGGGDRQQTQQEMEEEFRRRTSSVCSADLEPNWYYGSKSASGERESCREIIQTRTTTTATTTGIAPNSDSSHDWADFPASSDRGGPPPMQNAATVVGRG